MCAAKHGTERMYTVMHQHLVSPIIGPKQSCSGSRLIWLPVLAGSEHNEELDLRVTTEATHVCVTG